MRIRTIIALSSIIPTLMLAFSIQTFEKERLMARRFLGLIFLIIALFTTGTVILSNYQFLNLFPLGYMLSVITIALGPLFLFYLRSSFDKNFKFYFWHAFLFVPSLAIFSFFLYKTVTVDPMYIRSADKLIYVTCETLFNGALYLLVPYILHISGISYSAFFFNFKRLRLVWIRFLYVSLIVILLTKTIVFYIMADGWYFFTGLNYYYVFTAFFLTISLYIILNKEKLFQTKRYQHSTMSDKTKKLHFKTIVNALESKELYLDPELTLNTLAAECDISAKSISQIVNEIQGLHFNEFINNYRVEHSCRLLKQSDCELNILEIQLESGFNSKSSFNTAFKKYTGMTPRQYKQNCQEKTLEQNY